MEEISPHVLKVIIGVEKTDTDNMPSIGELNVRLMLNNFPILLMNFLYS